MKIDNLLGDKDPCINMKLFSVLSAFIELLYYIFFKLHLESNKLPSQEYIRNWCSSVKLFIIHCHISQYLVLFLNPIL